MTLRCIAVDDEPVALEIIRSHAEKIPYLNVLGTFTSGSEALAFARREAVDLIFLDVRMPDISGLDLAALFGDRARIIFTTAYVEFAVQGFELDAEDYLLKPIGFARFLKACERACKPAAQQYLFLKEGYDWVRVDTSMLLYAESADNYVSFVSVSGKTLVRMTLSEALDRLPSGEFIRIHKSFVVSLRHVQKVERHQVIAGGKAIPLAASYREALLKRLG
ncbi:LytR/AlgR family response regulator transcription factor [Siphonobacter aquaeclarae]|uniref:Two component transcriptional regulator, LytTR family n=1 Tax=Siphonobacter aquaeclarae TaxID=563176 RepID=A0A1G9HTN7_9BACT|nr:LytTR family DNA-binding domain-containing protein [Siphonobacter aquaeclarae]SDL16331.1 two component transcriptional regulator, LytTR family [Siphonobacter aquaeclarae]